MNTREFKKLITQHFSPKIRQLDWKGSGSHFYQRTPYHVVNIFGIQGSWTGGSVCCETAIHFDFIPNPVDKKIDISKITYASCLIRKRLSPKGEGDYHWIFSNKEEQNLKSINQILEAFETYGPAFYSDFANFPHPFDSIKPEDLKENNNYILMDKYHISNPILFTWLLKEINLFIDRSQIAKSFSDLGLSWALEHARKMATNARSKRAKEDIEHYIAAIKNMFT